MGSVIALLTGLLSAPGGAVPPQDTIPQAWVVSALAEVRAMRTLLDDPGRLVLVDAPAFRAFTMSDSVAVARITESFGGRGRTGDQSKGKDCVAQLGRVACQDLPGYVTLSLARVTRTAIGAANFDLVVGQPTDGRTGMRLDAFAFKVSVHPVTGAQEVQLLYIARAE